MSRPEIEELVRRLAALPGSDRLFNPYAPLGEPAAAIRRANLARYLTDMERFEPRVLLVAEAPGYRGCALTGIPVTSERIMLAGVEKWGLFGAGYHPTSGRPRGVAEMTATILWTALVEHLAQPPVIWNAVPLHPHQPGQRQTNRTPTLTELRMGQPFLEAVQALYPVERVLAVGRKAERVLSELGIVHVALRHPSQGGKAEFVKGLRRALDETHPA